MKDKVVHDIVTDSEVQHMRKATFQQHYITMVHDLGWKPRTSNKNMFMVST